MITVMPTTMRNVWGVWCQATSRYGGHLSNASVSSVCLNILGRLHTGAELPVLVVSSFQQQQQQQQHCTPDWRVDSTGFEFQQEQEILSPSKPPDQLWSPHSLLFGGYEDYFPEVKRPGREDNHSPLSSAGVKNKRSYATTPSCIPS